MQPTRKLIPALILLALAAPLSRADVEQLPPYIAAPKEHPEPSPTPTWTPPPHESLPLGKSAGNHPFDSAEVKDSQRSSGAPGSSPLLRTVGSLALVIAIIFGIRWFLTKSARFSGGVRSQLGAGGKAPAGVIQILARYPIARGQTLVLLKLDRRILLLNQTSDGFRALTELDDADDVASILRACRDEEGASLSSRFSSLLRSLERDPTTAETNDLRTTAQPVRLMDFTPHAPDLPQPDEPEETHALHSTSPSQHLAPADRAADELRQRLTSLRGYAQ